MLIAPSILAADFGNLQKDIRMINQSEADWIHMDVMDGVFVPNISFGIPVCRAVAKVAKKPLDVHLMIVKPENYLSEFKECGADTITVHYEACNHLHRVVHQIKELGCKAGVALNPHTNLSGLSYLIRELDLVLIMSVNPGFGGQSFIETTYPKVKALRDMIKRTGSQARIEVDGGVNLDNAGMLAEAGVDVLVAGNTVFKSPNPSEVISSLKNVQIDRIA